jgi:hypothetical protein
MRKYKIEWEMPDNADAHKFYEGDTTTPLDPSKWPTELDSPWYKTSRESDDVASIQDQFYGLKEVALQGHPIRNIKVFTSEVIWKEMEQKN